LTISPALLDELQNTEGKVEKKLDAKNASGAKLEKVSYIDNEANFRFYFNEDQMATEKLSEGIRKFAADAVTLKEILKQKINA
jgi:transaldolase